MRELRERNPEVEIGLSTLVVKPPIEVEILRLEELLDRVANASQARGGLVEGRVVADLEERLRNDAVRVEVTLIRADDVSERLLDRAIRSHGGELQLVFRERTAALQQLLRRPNVVAHLPEHRWRRHAV